MPRKEGERLLGDERGKRLEDAIARWALLDKDFPFAFRVFLKSEMGLEDEQGERYDTCDLREAEIEARAWARRGGR